MNLDARREREKQQRYESILDAAEQVFASKGYDRCSMDEIARTAQLSRALLYVYFKDKAAILDGIVLRSMQNLRDRFSQAINQGERGIQQIARIGNAYYAFSREEPYYFDVLTQSGASVGADEAPPPVELQCCGAEIMQLMVKALTTGVADGSLCPKRVADPLKTAYFLRGALHGVITEVRQPHAEARLMPDADTLIAYTIEMLGHAMSP